MQEEKLIRKYRNKEAGFPEQFQSPSLKDQPETIYMEGKTELLNGPVLAVVGSRKCSPYGASVSREIGRQAAKCGVAVVSGLAAGIDSSAQRACLHHGGKVIAVLGNGLDQCYPAENKGLMEEIRNRGLLISEYPPGFEAKPWTFPRRNRLIAALADAVTVVEASFHSGALTTAEYAVEQNKPLMVVPGNITSRCSVGTNRLLAFAGTGDIMPVCSVSEIFQFFGKDAAKEKREALGSDEQKIMDAVASESEIMVEKISAKTGFSPQYVNSLVTILEMKGWVQTSMGRVFAADNN
jgi:DNA processing protein